MDSLPNQMSLFGDKSVVDALEKYVDYSGLGKTQAMEQDLNILEDFINHYGETMIPLLEGYLRKQNYGK